MRTTRVLAGCAALVAPVGVTLWPSWADAAPACDVFADTPFRYTSYEAGGRGGRAGCISRGQVSTRLKYSRFGPEPTVGYRGNYEINVTWTAYGCGGTQSYDTKTETSSGQESESLRRDITCIERD